MPAIENVIASLTEAAVSAQTQLEFRREAVRQLSSVVGFDVVCAGRLQGEADPSPLLIDVRLSSWQAFISHPQQMLGELMPLVSAAYGQGRVALDTDHLGARSRDRSLFYEHCVRPNGSRSFLAVHLALRGKETTVMHLGRKAGSAFKAKDLELMRRFVPVLSLGDALLDEQPEVGAVEGAVLEDPGWLRITRKEREVAELSANGLSNAEVATALHRSPHTVRNQLASVYEKLGLTNRAELARAMLQVKGALAMPPARLARRKH